MTKSEFLSELENALEGRLPVDEINEILADYSEIYDNSASDVGSPAKIARKILEDLPDNMEQKNYQQPVSKTCRETQNLASLSTRVGAYIIDNILGALLIFIISLVAFLPFSTQERVTFSQIRDGSGYEVKFYKDNNGVTIKAEVLDPNNKLVFKGSEDGYIEFLDKNKLRIPEDFKSRLYVKTVKRPLPIKTNLVLTLMLLGLGNPFNALIAWKFKGYTLGKRLFRIRTEKIDNTEITFADSFLREFVMKSIVNLFTGGLLNLGSFIWACFNDEQTTLHDKAVKTRVITVRG
jgi:uncharacterized RDD family membrane protein YckC